MTPTPAQQAAIETDAPEILVSAAAGSGKTAVLTQRILRHVLSNIGIDRLLVVTFTEAAAAEMKERVTDKIHELLETGAGVADKVQHLSDQAALLATADISTIHAFCRKLVKEHFQAVEVDPAFRVADESELGIIKKQVMDEVFAAAYEEEDAGFIDLVNVYGGKARDDRLDALVRRLHNFLESDPFPMAKAREYATGFDEAISLDDSPWAGMAKMELIVGLDGIVHGLQQAMKVCHLPGGPEKYIEQMEENEAMIKALRMRAVELPFSEVYKSFLAVDWGRLPAVKEKDMVDAALKERAQRIRDKEAKGRLKDLVGGVFFAPPGKMQADLAALAPRVAALMNLVQRYMEAFAAEKRNRNLLDFSDLEHFAIKVLYPDGPEDMTPGYVAAALKEKFYEVLIDEYQDSNKVQDLILSAVAKRRFMVGDVKQSIYRFRRANPGLFVEKYNRFAPLEPPSLEAAHDAIRIDLSQNFRSRAGVIDAVNFFFSQLMCPDVGEVSYDNAAALHTGADYPDLPADTFPGMWVEILDQSGLESPEIDEAREDEEPVAAVIAETRMIAASIHELLATRQVWDKHSYRPCQLGDIVILARSANSLAKDVIEELKNCGIDAVADTAAAFYEQLEIKTALAFLRITDNPRQDIDLIAALSSPSYGFTPDELYQIRQHPIDMPNKKQADFYDHLVAYAIEDEKASRFLQDLEAWRRASTYLAISRLIGKIYDDTSYPSHAGLLPGGEIRQANLRLLLERAIEFEETSFKGLFHFIQYIQRLVETDNKVSGAASPSEDIANRVRFMSIHKSKGLEFPIVITGFLGKPFNLDDERQPIILHGEKGLGPKYVNLKRRTRSKTLAHYGLARLTRRENLSEELRCLYVAMTRAKELLILTGRTINLERDMEKWSDAASILETRLSIYYRQSSARFLDWIMPCLLRHQDAAALTDGDVRSGDHHPSGFDIRIHRSLMQFDAPIIEMSPSDALHEPLKLINPVDESTTLPSKLSISEIKRLYVSDISPDSIPLEDSPPTFDPPAFIQAGESLTPMRMGSALHTIVEHMDFHIHVTPATITKLKAQLVEKNLLTQEESAAIDISKIEKLAHSTIADRIRTASNVYRETPFVMAIPASEIYADRPNSKESILVHGIIDCYFEEEGQLVLLDFKSENPGPSPKAWANTHRTQLMIYKKALEAATAKRVKEVILYSFSFGAYGVS